MSSSKTPTDVPGDLPTEARQGRDKQRYSPSGLRLVAGIVALSPTKTHVLLVQSTKRTGWVLPKGGWETDEATASDAAVREAWEEAGVVCAVTRDLGTIQDTRESKEMTGHAPASLYQFFEARVEREEAIWPEMHKRGREWMDWKKARAALVGREELLEALARSGLMR